MGFKDDQLDMFPIRCKAPCFLHVVSCADLLSLLPPVYDSFYEFVFFPEVR